MTSSDFVLFVLAVIPVAFVWAAIDAWREKREFRKWLREGRWKFEKFKY